MAAINDPLWKRIAPDIDVDLTQRDKQGRFVMGHTPLNKKFPNGPHEMWAACCAYFESIDSDPMREPKLSTTGKVVSLDRPRPYTKQGLLLSTGTNGMAWHRWADPDDIMYRPELVPVMEAADAVLHDQKLTYGMLNIFNASLVARDLKMSEHTEAAVHTTDDTPKGDGHMTVSVQPFQSVPMYPHPDDPDPEGITRGGETILYTMTQIVAGVPFTEPKEQSDAEG
jgi:hypothetical protein